MSEASRPRTAPRPGELDPGLCARCAHARCLESARGARFWQCQRARSDPRFPRYPRLPVLRCPGFEEGAPDTASD